MTVWMQRVPLRAQLSEPTLDGQSDENRAANCVPAALSSGLSYLSGQAFYGDELKDAVYGQGYTGATDPVRFMDYFTGRGVRMTAIGQDSTAATAGIIAAIQAGHLATGAIPSDWNNVTAAEINAHGGPTHEVLWCGYDDQSGLLTAMNPEMAGVAGWQVMPLGWWASRIVYGRYFTMEGTHVTWARQADMTGRDAAGHNCGEGDMDYLQANGLTGYEGRASETFYSAQKSFLPLSNGVILRYVAGQGTDTDGAAVALDLLQLLQEARAAGSGQLDALHVAAYNMAEGLITGLRVFAQAGQKND